MGTHYLVFIKKYQVDTPIIELILGIFNETLRSRVRWERLEQGRFVASTDSCDYVLKKFEMCILRQKRETMAKVLRVLPANYRFKLKSAIINAEFKTQGEFCRAIDLDEGEMSRILYGLAPTRPSLHKIAKGLKLNVTEVKKLL